MRKEKVKLIDSIIAIVNETLEKDWTMEETTAGRNIDIQKSWVPAIKDIVYQYRKCGWTVSRHAEICSARHGAHHYLRFINPNYLTLPKEMRATGVKLKRNRIKVKHQFP